MLKVKTNNRKGFDIARGGDGIDFSYPTSTTRRGRVQHGLSHTLQREGKEVGVVDESGYRIRKLTPLECWRLMGFDDGDYERAADKGR